MDIKFKEKKNVNILICLFGKSTRFGRDDFPPFCFEKDAEREKKSNM